MEEKKAKALSYSVFIALLVLIFIRPFISGLAYPRLENYYQNLIIFLAIITLLVNKKVGLKNSYTPALLMLFLAHLISIAHSVNIENSFKETIKFVSYIALFFVVSQADDGQKKSLIKAIVFAASLISLYSIYQYFWGYQHTLDYLKKIQSDFLLTSSYAKDILIAKRAIGTFPSPPIFGGYLIAVLFLSLSLIKGAIGSKRWYLAAPLIIIALILTKSMSAWLCLVFALIILYTISYRLLKKQKLITILSLALIALVLGFILASRWERLIDLENPQNSIIERLNYWRTAVSIIKDHPVLGVGAGNFQEVYLKYKIGLSTDTRYAHNIFLHQWAETGVLGFLGLLALLIILLKRFKKGETKNILIFLAGFAFIAHNLIDNTYFIPQAGFLFWILLVLM